MTSEEARAVSRVVDGPKIDEAVVARNLAAAGQREDIGDHAEVAASPLALREDD